MATYRRNPTPPPVKAPADPSNPEPTPTIVPAPKESGAPVAVAGSSAPVPVAASAPVAVSAPSAPDEMPGDPPVSRAVLDAQIEQGARFLVMHKAIVEHLQSEQVAKHMETVALPGFAKKAIDAAVVYVSDRADRKAWEELVKCTPDSIVNAVGRLAAIGLTVSYATGSGWLVPRWDSKEAVNKATPMPGIRGYEELMWGAGPVTGAASGIIREQDNFVGVQGSEPDAKNIVNLRPDPSKSNKVIGAYAVLTHENYPKVPKIVQITPIEERSTPGKMSGQRPTYSYFLLTGEQINTSRMPITKAGAYVPLRDVYRDAARTWMKDNERLAAALEMEDSAYRTGEEIQGAQPVLTIRETKGIQVTDAKVATVEPAGHTNGNGNGNGRTLAPDPLAIAAARATEDVGNAPHIPAARLRM